MIIYGVGVSKGEPLQTTITCPKCGEPESIIVFPVQRYAHVFWIPLFPLDKRYGMVCSKCEEYFDQKELPISYEIKKAYKTPQWTYIGILIIVAFAAYVMVTSKSSKEIISEKYDKVENPVKGQIYEIELDEKEYTLMRVEDAIGDSIYFSMHTHYTNKKKGIKNLDKNNFEEDVFALSKDHVLEMVYEGDILDIRD